MRSTRSSKYSNKNKPCSYKVHKKKRSRKSKGIWGCNFDVSTSYLENINEILRLNKCQQADGKGSWKIMPKDSCEVYKDRQNRRNDNKGDDGGNNFCEECLDDEARKNKESHRRRNVKKKRAPVKRPIQRRKKQRYDRDSSPSMSSYEYTTSLSNSSISYTSVSDLEDE